MACSLLTESRNVTYGSRNGTDGGGGGGGTNNIDHVRHVVNDIIIPTICLLGLLGNITNLYVFGRRWRQQGTQALEKASLAGLMALALSDLFFCCVGFPAAVFHRVAFSHADSPVVTLAYMYMSYKKVLLNLAIFSSTWCIVVISLARYVAVCHPFRARWFIRWWKTVLTHLGIFLFSILIALPEFIRFSVHSAECYPGCICRFVIYHGVFDEATFRTAHMVLWSTVGTLIPLGLLAYFNIRLLLEIYRSKTQGLTDPDRYCSSRLTLTVIGIITLFLVLVCPSMVLTLLKPLTDAGNGGGSGGSGSNSMSGFLLALYVTNMMQAVKFASNFLLYMTINKQFRETLTCAIRRPTWSVTTSGSPNKVEMTTVKL